MSIPIINHNAPQIPGQKPELSLAGAAKEALKKAAELEVQTPAGQIKPEDVKQAAAKKLLADTVDISPQGKAASQALMATLGANKAAQSPEPKAKDDDVKNNKDKEDPQLQPRDGAPASEDAKAPAPKEGAGGAGGEDDEGGDGGKDSPDRARLEQKLEALQKQGEKLKEEIDELKREGEENAEAISQKEAEKAQISAQINMLNQQLQAVDTLA